MNSPQPSQSLAQACSLDSQEEFCMCCYHNQNGHIQIIRICDIRRQCFERVVFPGQRLMFQANPQAMLEVVSAKAVGALVADTIRCDRLRVSGNSLG